MKADGDPLSLLDPEQAVSSYLDDLFSEAPVTRAACAPQLVTVSETPVTEKIQTETLSRLLSVTPIPEGTADSGTTPDGGTSYEPCVPFQVILLELAGLKLALPLQELNGILKCPSKLSQVPFSAPWVRGIYATGEHNTRIVDTAALLLPSRYRVQNNGDDQDDQQHLIVLVGDGEWGLDCLGASDVIELQPEQVNWRSDRSKRPWLAGTVREHLCALLDTAAFTSWLERGIPGD